MKKALMLSSVASMIDQFNMENIYILQEMGYEVHVACNFDVGSTTSQQRIREFKEELSMKNIKVYNISVPRTITHILDICRAYQQVKLISKHNRYALIHCHSPIGGVIARIGFRKFRKKGTKIIYTAHGFHFFKGASIWNWILFYPIEKLCSQFTDCLITINKEDYNIAKKLMNRKSGRAVYIPGIGINTRVVELSGEEKVELKKELNIPDGHRVMLSVGELSKRKNHYTAIKAFAKANLHNTVYLICGIGELLEEYKNMVEEFNINDKVIFAGYRDDIEKVLQIADVFVFPSYQEGLPVALMEAMAAGLPVISSNIRGNNDLIRNNQGGYLIDPSDIEGFSQSMVKLIQDTKLMERMGNYNKDEVLPYDKVNIREKMIEVYKSVN